MDYEFVKGTREGSELLYTTADDMLFVFKCARSGAREYICYQTILSAPKKRDNVSLDIDTTECTARVKILKDGTCKRMGKYHTNHADHKSIKGDLKKRNNLKSLCQTVKDDFPEDSHKLSTRRMFQREIAK